MVYITVGYIEKVRVRGEKSYGYDYITKLGYDKFEQRSYLSTATARRRSTPTTTAVA